ncbi:MAG TPA: tetratricopeptide repeat protein [Anaerolineales bacterium]
MNNNSLHLEHDLGLSFQDRIDILFHEIELAVRWDRPSILFAIYKSDFIRDEVDTLLREKLKKISQKTHSIKTSHGNQIDFLSQISQLPDLSQTVLLIDGFNWECGTEGVRVFEEFNKNREYFIDNNIRAIFWLFENEVSDFAANATECWILRHRVVEFVDVPQQDQGVIQSLESLWQSADNSPADEYLSDVSPDEILNLQDSEKVTSSHANALLSLGILFWRRGNPQNALKYLQASAEISILLANHSLQAQCQNALALVQTELGNIDDAVSAYKRAISLSPESEFLWNNMGQLLAKNERNEEAINAFKKALSISPRDFLSWDGAGHIHIKLGLYQNAISAFEKALEIAPYYESSWAGIGRAYLESGQLEKAEGSLRKAVELNVHLIDTWINLGKCFTQQKRNLDAIAVYHKAIEFNPQSADIWDELGRLHLQRQNYAESISAFQKVISLNHQCSEAYIRLAHALFQIGDYETSASIYEESIPLFDDNATRSALLNRLGDIYLYMKDYEKAIGAYQQSDQLLNDLKKFGDKNTEVTNEIHNTHLNNDQKNEQDNSEKERGEKMIEASHVFDLKTAAEWNEHGNNHLRAGAYNDAIVAYTKAIELAPDACWPYIQNLSNVHYQKGKARGKLTVGKIEDPDIWEGEDEPDAISLFSYDAISTPERNDTIEEPRLEKPNNNYPIGQLPASIDAERAHSDISDPVECCSNQKNETALEPEEEASNTLTGKSNTKIEVPQKLEPGVNIPSENTLTPPLVENTQQNSIDWNKLGNSYASSKKFNNAIDAYKKAIEIDPKYGQPYGNLGFIYYRLGKYEDAILLYKKSIDLLDTPEDIAASWNRLGDTYRRLGDYRNALAAYQKSSEMAPAMSPVMARGRATLMENIVAG